MTITPTGSKRCCPRSASTQRIWGQLSGMFGEVPYELFHTITGAQMARRSEKCLQFLFTNEGQVKRVAWAGNSPDCIWRLRSRDLGCSGRQWSSPPHYGKPSAHLVTTNFRQLLHAAFTIAVKIGRRYFDLLEANEDIVARNVTHNLLARHIGPVFLGTSQ